MDASGADIAFSFRRAIYDESSEGEMFFGMSERQFTQSIYSNGLVFAPDGCDEAFDDHSYILQFEDQNQVRIIAFTGTSDFSYDPASLSEVRLSQDDFYGVLQKWHDRFHAEWSALHKMTDTIHIQ
jgi:hypothetical protein